MTEVVTSDYDVPPIEALQFCEVGMGARNNSDLGGLRET